jgi:O-antigen ligase
MLGWFVVSVAALSAVLSIVHFGFGTPDWHWGRRLGNSLVYGGWNQVCSGVTWAFAAVWALLLGMQGERSRELRWLAWGAHLVLVFAALASLSRGALLVLLVGQAAALVFAGWKAGAGWSLLRFLAVFAFFHAVLPSTVPEADEGARFPRVIDSNPLKEWSRRADTGRFEMYAAVFETLKAGGPRYWLMGDGLWGMNSRWNHSIEERPLHPHSVFFATALHGGLLGLAGLLIVLGSGLLGALKVARRADGWAAGLVLALAGLAGLVFDGHSLASLDSIPRFEPLILWPGLMLAAGRLSLFSPSGKL